MFLINTPDKTPPKAFVVITIVYAVFVFFLFILAVPFTGIIIRLRANYTPQGPIRLVEQETEESAREFVTPQITSFWGILKRIKRVEGWSGYFKGFIPTYVGGFTLALIAGGIAVGINKAFSIITYEEILAITYLDSLLVLVLTLPLTVLINRATTTPIRLPWFTWNEGKKVVFSLPERKNILSVYLLPGLFWSLLLQTVFLLGSFSLVQSLLFPLVVPIGQEPYRFDIKWWKVGIYVIFVIFETLISTPLDVIAVRLSLQRRQNRALELPEGGADSEALGGDAEDSFVGERVVEIRPAEYAYTGVIDCARKIVREEGVGVLYRAWWVNFITLLLGVTAGGPRRI